MQPERQLARTEQYFRIRGFFLTTGNNPPESITKPKTMARFAPLNGSGCQTVGSEFTAAWPVTRYNLCVCNLGLNSEIARSSRRFACVE